MNQPNLELIKKNPKIDQKVVSAAIALLKKMPEEANQKQGSDFKIAPPLGGQALKNLTSNSKK